MSTKCPNCGAGTFPISDDTPNEEHIGLECSNPKCDWVLTMADLRKRAEQAEVQLRINHTLTVQLRKEVDENGRLVTELQAKMESIEADRDRLQAEVERAKQDLDRALRPWRVSLSVANPGGPDLYEQYECEIVDIGYSDRVLTVESKELQAEVERLRGIVAGLLPLARASLRSPPVQLLDYSPNKCWFCRDIQGAHDDTYPMHDLATVVSAAEQAKEEGDAR